MFHVHTHPEGSDDSARIKTAASARRSPISPAAYRSIFGNSCEHAFKKEGFCITYLAGFGDGFNGEGLCYLPRIQAIQALFAIKRTSNTIGIVRRIYRAIDNAFPVDVNPVTRFDIYHDLYTDVWERLLDRMATAESVDDLLQIARQFENLAALNTRLGRVVDVAGRRCATNEIERIRNDIEKTTHKTL